MSSSEQRKLIELLGGIYHEILPIEQELGLRVSNADQRPRIDYFHDALRALTNTLLPMELREQRLSIEWLAYDAGAIRYIQSTPLSVLNPKHTHLSPHTEVLKKKEKSLIASRTPSREDKASLSQLYLRYGVIFVALFKPFADRDYHDRVEDMERQAEELAGVLHAVEGLGQGKASVTMLDNAAMQCQFAEVQKMIGSMLKKKAYKDPQKLAQVMQALRQGIQGIDNSISGVEASHMNYATAQLSLCEAGKAIVQQLAAQGVRIAGPFTETAIAQAGTDKSRGR